MSDSQVSDRTDGDQGLRDEWIAEVNSLVAQAEEWARKRSWHPERQQKVIRNDPAGEYEVPQLWIAPGGRVVFLDPTSRFLPGGKGIVDLYLWPEMDPVMVPWTEDGWHVHLSSGQFEVNRIPWSESAFEQAINHLIEP